MQKSSKLQLLFLAIIWQNFSVENVFAGNPQSVNSLAFVGGNGPSAKYNRNIFNHVTEYPIAINQSIGATLQASYINFDRNNQMDSTSSYALNSAEIFHRYKFLSYKKLSVTIGNLYKFPGIYHENAAQGLPPQQADYEMRFFFAYNMQDRMTNQVIRGSNTYFMRPEIAYRRRFSNPFDEVRFTFTGGLKLHPKFLLLFQDNIIWNVASKSDSVTNSYSNPSNFQFSKDANNMSTTSIIYRLNNEVALQAGYIKRLHGNAGIYDARGFILGLWTSF